MVIQDVGAESRDHVYFAFMTATRHFLSATNKERISGQLLALKENDK